MGDTQAGRRSRMAGPGSGPPRKSHTKSRKGCRTCKSRHIRCDEAFPQCRNCTKHNCRCDYMDMPAVGEEPVKGSHPPDLMMSADLQQRLDSWRLTGESLLPDLRSNDQAYWMRFSTVDLRLIHHVVTLSTEMRSRQYSACTAWALKMPTLIDAALTHDFVMSALLALSASHLAWQTGNHDTENLVHQHRGVALKALHEAIGAFSRENSEAILAASMLLSWQAPEWRSWASLQQGVSTVMNAMRPWAHESDLAIYLDGQKSIAQGRMPGTPPFPNSASSPANNDLRRLEEAIVALRTLTTRLGNNKELVDQTSHVLDYFNNLRRDLPISSPERAFTRLQSLREMIFWLPPRILLAGDSDLAALTLLSHLYTAALAIEPLFPEIGGAYLGTMCLLPSERIHDILRSRRNAQPQDVAAQIALTLVEFPMQIVSTYKSRQRTSNANFAAYRSSPIASAFHHPQMPLASPAGAPTTLYSHSTPLQSGLHPTSYFPTTSAGTVRRDSPALLPQFASQLVRTDSPHTAIPAEYEPQARPLAQYRTSFDTRSKQEYYTQPQSQYQYYIDPASRQLPSQQAHNPHGQGRGSL